MLINLSSTKSVTYTITKLQMNYMYVLKTLLEPTPLFTYKLVDQYEAMSNNLGFDFVVCVGHLI